MALGKDALLFEFIKKKNSFNFRNNAKGFLENILFLLGRLCLGQSNGGEMASSKEKQATGAL